MSAMKIVISTASQNCRRFLVFLASNLSVGDAKFHSVLFRIGICAILLEKF